EVSALRFARGDVAGVSGTTVITGLDPATAATALEVTWVDGSPETLSALGDDQALVADRFADEHGVGVGDRLEIGTPTGRRVTVTVAGTYDDAAGLFGSVVMPNAVLARDFNVTNDAVALATTADGADADTVRDRAERALGERYPTVQVLTKEGFKDDQ